jgi:hypothetical protein
VSDQRLQSLYQIPFGWFLTGLNNDVTITSKKHLEWLIAAMPEERTPVQVGLELGFQFS